LEDGGIDKAEGVVGVRSFIGAHWLSLATSHYPHELIMVLAKDAQGVAGLFLPISRYAPKGRKSGRFL